MATVMYPPQGTYQSFGGALGGSMGQGASQVINMWVQGQMQMKMQEATRVREQATKIVTSMRKNPAMKNRLVEYDEWINPTATEGEGVISMRKAAGPKEGSTAWAREVVKRFGDVASPMEELEREMVDIKTRALKMLKLTGEEGTPQQRGISPGVVAGFEKPGDPLKQLELQLQAMGVLDAQTRTQIQSLRARIAQTSEERAGREFKKEQIGKAETRGIAKDRLTADRINQIYNRLGRRLEDIEKVLVADPADKTLDSIRARVDSMRQLKNVEPREAQEAATFLCDHILSAARDMMTTTGKKGRDAPEYKNFMRDLRSELRTLYKTVGLPVRQAIQTRMEELQRYGRTPEDQAMYEELVNWVKEVW